MDDSQDISISESEMAQEARQKIQDRQKVAELFKKYRAQVTSSQTVVTVTSDPAAVEEKICLTVNEKKKVVPFTVMNSGTQTVYLTLWAPDLVKTIFAVSDSEGFFSKTIRQHTLGPGETYKIRVHFSAEYPGFYEHMLVFKFRTDPASSDVHEIMRLLEVRHRMSPEEEPLPVARNSQHTQQTEEEEPVESFGGNVTWNTSWRVPLEKYPLPDKINMRIFNEMETNSLDWENYSKRFQLLLHLEELKLKTDLEKYNQPNVTMRRHKNCTDLLVLQVTGNSCRSTIRLSGNEVLVTPLDPGAFPGDIYRGWVRCENGDEVYIKFSDSFLIHFKDGMRFSVAFVINRMPLRLQHRAVTMVYERRLREVLFPTRQRSSHRYTLQRVSGLENNPEQCKAIQHIAAATAKPAPYLLFGPPGTGKTETLVEAIKQIVKTQPSSTILACAPSNSATDHLCEKIQRKIGTGNFYRFYATQHSVKNIPKNLQCFCNLNHETQMLMVPPRNVLMSFKILVTTLITAGRLVSIGIPPGHYTYIFVDEAGQATETECVIPIAGFLKPATCQLVLAGDPKQLGPVITSALANKHGMGVSLLERLMRETSLYKAHETKGFNNCFVTKLLRNYRSHPSILKVPNEVFYEGELLPYAPKGICNSFCKWDRLPKKDFPVIFHGVAGFHERDNGPSLYNMAEVEVLKDYLKSILDHLHKRGVMEIERLEIGIITPYRKQVEKIQNALRMDNDLKKENLENIAVGSVEKFQGKEFNVTLLSTVRSTPKLTVDSDQFTLGFVSNAKRFNVAVTRAQALLIVVGDPRALKTDDIWNKFICYCFKNGGYCGITVSEEEKNVLVTRRAQHFREKRQQLVEPTDQFSDHEP